MHALAYSYAGACLFQNGWWRHYVLFFWSFLSNHWCFENETADAHVLQLFCLRSITIFSSFWLVSQMWSTFPPLKTFQRSLMLFCLKIPHIHSMFCLCDLFCLYLAYLKIERTIAMWLQLFCFEILSNVQDVLEMLGILCLLGPLSRAYWP